MQRTAAAAMSRHSYGQRSLHNLLLIDDDLISREVLATLLTMSGLTVQTAEDGESALALLAAGAFAPEIILVDAQMPGLSGAPLIAELRSRSLKWGRARIFAISGSCPPSEVLESADGFLLKPFGPEALQALLAAETPQPASATCEPDLDPGEEIVCSKTLDQLRTMMPESGVREIFTLLVDDLDRRVHDLQHAIRNGNPAEVRRIGHAIKGGCSMAGAKQAARLGGLIEDGAVEQASASRPGSYQLDINAPVLLNLRAAAASLRRMLGEGFPA
jgi:CheY-like chemotaxis protein/HPt (histidine-containing phosphotransfer) domain-containing protein